jgi:RimJ/RimL family protein N-acetyltransferase
MQNPIPPLIRPFEEQDWPAVWQILHKTCLTGDTFVFESDVTEGQMRCIWVWPAVETFVACQPDGKIIGTYFIKANQPGLGSHFANCGYAVDKQAQGQGVAAAMCEHSQQRALALGFRSMQFNLVVSTNTRAVRLWQRLGFVIVGTLPRAFRHQQLGYVDAHVMYKQLVAD